jgi:hypothetical protein
MVSEVTS